MLPINVLAIWFRGLFVIALLAGGTYLINYWYQERGRSEPIPVAEVREPVPNATRDEAAPDRDVSERPTERVTRFTIDRETVFLVLGILLVVWSIGGGWALSPRWFRRVGNDEPHESSGSRSSRVSMPDGTHVRVETVGAEGNERLVFTHGWGLGGDEWYYAKKHLAGNHQVTTWDLPGLGGSDRPADGDWNLEKLARDLDRVISATGDGPVVLVGHSIGVMITLTYCKLFPESLGTRVVGLILVQGTYTNPVRTTDHAPLYTAIETPIIKPLCHLMVWLSPLIWLLNWMSYLNGSAHRSTERDSFSGNETRGQLDLITRLYSRSAPDVIGRGMLAMLRYDATAVLPNISVPTLVVAGENDKSTLPEASEFMAKLIPHARLSLLHGMKHCGHFELHEPFLRAVDEYLESLATTLRPAAHRGM